MRRLHVVPFAIVAAVVIACSISDSTVGPKTIQDLQLRPTVAPTTNSPCTVHWAAGVNGSWFDASKWSPAGVPGSTSSVCIDAAGTYTVTLDPVVDSIPVPVLAISVGGPAASPTLQFASEGGRLNVAEGVAISSGATLVFTSGSGNTLTAAGTITNAGRLWLASPCGGCGGATISADLINTGTLQISGGPVLTLSKLNGQYQNIGTITFGGFINIPATAGNAVFSQEGGLYGGAGNTETFTMRSGTFQLHGGKIRPRANLLPIVLLDGASLVIDSAATDSITLGVRGRTDAVPTITGNVSVLTTLWVAGASNGGNGTVELIGNPVNHGTMRVSRFVDVFGGITVRGSGRLTNVGTLNNTDANRDTLFYSIDLTNTGTINAVGQSSITLGKADGSYLNSGVIDLQAGISRLTIRSNGDFRNAAPGTITNGAVIVDGSQFHGVGTLLTVLNADNGGSIAPGDSIGLLTSNQLNIGTNGILNIELSGITPLTQYDRVATTSLAGFSGTLNIIERNGFQSGVCGQVFDVAHVPSIAAGMFPTINGLNPGPGRMLRALWVNQTASTPAKLRLVGFDPNAKVCVGPPNVALTEGGPTLQYAVALRDAPTSTVIVKAAGDAQVSAPDSAVFTTANWQTPQILNVSAVDDALYEGTHSGTVTHTVRSLDAAYNGVAAGSIIATITDNDVPPLVATTVTVTIDSSSIEVGHTAHASAVVRDQNGDIMAGESVTWSSDTPGFASVSASGIVTGIAAGSAVIRATDGDATGTASITISAPPPPPPVVTTITVSIDSASLQIPHTAQATAVVRDQYGAVMSGQTVAWSSDTPSFAGISNAGVVSAVAAGSAVIRATIGSVFGTASVTITNAPPPPPVVTTITVAIDSSSLQVPHTAQGTATVHDQYGAVMSGQTVSWSSDTPSFASVSASGVVTAVAQGTAVIRASIGGVSGTGSVTVTPAPPPPPVPTTISVAIDSSSLQVGHTAQATATVRDQYNDVMSGQTITWTSDTPGFAGVSNIGIVTGVAAGSATIRGTVGSLSATASLTITGAPLPPALPTTMSVSIDSASLHVGNIAQASAIVRDQFGTPIPGQTVRWRAATPSLVSVSSTGLVSARRAGTASVEASLGALTATASITVLPAPGPTLVKSVTVTLDSVTMALGSSAQARAVALDAKRSALTGLPITWTSLTPSVATVSPSGVVTGIGIGKARIQAEIEGVAGTATVHSYVYSGGSVGAGISSFGGSPYCDYVGDLEDIRLSVSPRNGGFSSLSAVLFEFVESDVNRKAAPCSAEKRALYNPTQNRLIEFIPLSVVVGAGLTPTIDVEFVSKPGPYPEIRAAFGGIIAPLYIVGEVILMPFWGDISFRHIDAAGPLSWSANEKYGMQPDGN